MKYETKVTGENTVSVTAFNDTDKPVTDAVLKVKYERRKPSLWARIWSFFYRPIKTVPADAGWEENDWYSPAAYKNVRLAALARQAERIKLMIEKARKQKKARKHLYAALEANTAERLRVEGGQ